MFKKEYTLFYIAVFLFILLFFIAEIVNDRFWLNDFKVYYGASGDFLGSNSMYQHPYGLGSGWFKYSPLFAMVFSVFHLFSFKIASILFYWIVGLLILIYFPKFLDLFNSAKSSKKRLLVLVFAFVFIADHLVRELHLGNVNYLLLILVYGVYESYKNNKLVLGAILFALVVLLKPYFMLIGLYFLLRKEWKFILYTVVACFVFLLLPSVVLGFSGNLEFHKEWVTAMMNHNNEITSFNYLSGSFKLHFGINISIFVFIALFALTYIVSYFKFLHKNQEIAFFVLIAIIPNLVLTDTEHFLYSIPLIFFLLNSIKLKLNIITVIPLIGLFLYGLNWGFIWGENIGSIVISGIIGLGNLLIITAAFLLVYKENFSLKSSMNK